MVEYTHKGFKICYEVKPIKDGSLYQAQGYIMDNKDPKEPSLIEKFQTESPTANNAQLEIKRLIEDYIDFEYEQFLNLKKDK